MQRVTAIKDYRYITCYVIVLTHAVVTRLDFRIVELKINSRHLGLLSIINYVSEDTTMQKLVVSCLMGSVRRMGERRPIRTTRLIFAIIMSNDASREELLGSCLCQIIFRDPRSPNADFFTYICQCSSQIFNRQ